MGEKFIESFDIRPKNLRDYSNQSLILEINYKLSD